MKGKTDGIGIGRSRRVENRDRHDPQREQMSPEGDDTTEECSVPGTEETNTRHIPGTGNKDEGARVNEQGWNASKGVGEETVREIFQRHYGRASKGVRRSPVERPDRTPKQSLIADVNRGLQQATWKIWSK